MDPPHFLHHRHRYVPAPTIHPPRADFPHEPNLYMPISHHTHSFPQPPPQHEVHLRPPPQHVHVRPPPPDPSYRLPPPPPPEPSYRLPAPPPPSLHPYHTNRFSFSNPNHNNQLRTEDDNPRLLLRDFATHSPRVQNRIPDDRSHSRLPELDHFYSDNRPRAWDPSRVATDNKPVRSHPSSEFERELHSRQLDHRPISPYRAIDMFNSEGNFRSRVEYKDGFELNQRENQVRGRGDENYPRHDLGFSSDQSSFSRDIELSSGSFISRSATTYENESFRGGREDGHYEIKRWISRDESDSLVDRENNHIGDDDGFRILSRKREYHGSDLERHSTVSRGNGESSHHYTRSPKKQVQKKSAFLRIQMAKRNYRSRENEDWHYSDYVENRSAGSFRGNDHLGFSVDKMEEEGEREGSPVELDVSFKSNSLVAKAIVAPSISAMVSDTDSTPRNKKTKNVILYHGSPGSKLVEGTKYVNGSTDFANSPESGEKVTGYDVGKVLDGSSQPSRQKNGSLEKIGAEKSSEIMISVKDISSVGSVKRSPSGLVKKKVVRKVVKNVSPNLSSSNSTSSEKHEELVKADSSTDIPLGASAFDHGVKPLKGKDSSSGIALMHDVDMKRSPCKANTRRQDKRVIESPAAIVSERCEIDIDSGKEFVPSRKRMEDNSGCSFAEIKPDEIPAMVDSSAPSNAALNCKKDLITPLHKASDAGNTIYVNDLSGQNCSSLLENSTDKESRHAISTLEGNVSSAFVSSKEINPCENIVDRHRVIDDESISVGFGDGVLKSREKLAVCDSGIMDEIGMQLCTNQVTEPLDNDIADGFPSGTFSVRETAIVCSRRTEQIGMQNNSIIVDCSIIDCGPNCDSACLDSEENNAVPNSATEYRGERPPTDSDSIVLSLGNAHAERSPKATKAVGGREADTSESKKNIGRTQFRNLGSNEIYTHPVNSVDTTLSLSSCKDSSCAEVALSRDESVIVGILHAKLGFMHEKKISNKLSESKFSYSDDEGGSNEVSPECRKRRKLSVNFQTLPSSDIEVNEALASSCTSNPELPLTYNKELTHQGHEDHEIEACDTQASYVSCAMLHPAAVDLMLDCNLERESSDNVGAVRDTSSEDGMEFEHPSLQSLSPSALRREQKDASMAKNNNPRQIDKLGMDSGCEESVDMHASEGKVIYHGKVSEWRNTSELSLDLDQQFALVNKESDSPLGKDDLPCVSNQLNVSSYVNGVSTLISSDEAMGYVLDTLSDMGSPETLSNVENKCRLSCTAVVSQIPTEKVHVDGQKEDEMSMVKSESKMPDSSSSPSVNTNMNPAFGKFPLPSQKSKSSIEGLNLFSAKLDNKKKQVGHAISRKLPGQSTFDYTISRKSPSLTHNVKSRTWHRDGNFSSKPVNKPSTSTIPSRRQFLGKNGSQNSSYIRKGNSLVRKSAPVSRLPHSLHALSTSVYRSNFQSVEELRNVINSNSMVDVSNHSTHLRIEGTSPSIDRSRTPPLPSNSAKLPSFSSGESTSSQLVGPHLNFDRFEAVSDLTKQPETNNGSTPVPDALQISEFPENQIFSPINMESQTNLKDCNLTLSDMEQIVYIKCKSNQLVAKSNPSDLSVRTANKIRSISSDGYFKRRKNQLIRASLGCQVKEVLHIADGILNPNVQGAASKNVCRRSLTKRQPVNAISKMRRSLKSSLVWTLCGSRNSEYDRSNIHHLKISPHLFPWKRTYRRSSMLNLASISCSNSLSTISRKLLLSRKRDTLYTRSNNGFSLRKSKVLSVGGSSLKWSKSIEMRSQKANEEATRAVAAADRKKREQNGQAHVSYGRSNRSRSSGERIFRFGLVRYRMDPSRRTLQRISDDEPSCSSAPQSEKSGKKSYVPRRLVIGNDEYVRIGNGNQLVRDPKKRTRTLASEKVRWSLHTARQRLARKRRYCQFFTRFGTCNKDDGKCPYIHDPSKIAVCTKFLNGLCSDVSCKLTHKVIPERMPDCLYFLQGLCSNKNCAYRHVNVNPTAPTCEGFLRGYCAEGDECRKKHSYVCPMFEATGTCSQSNCKLHHPRKSSKGKKRKRSGKQNDQGRYFGSIHVDVLEAGTVASGKHSTRSDDIFPEGELLDFLSLDVSDEEDEEINESMSNKTSLGHIDPLNLELDDLGDLIKPVRIMTENLSI